MPSASPEADAESSPRRSQRRSEASRSPTVELKRSGVESDKPTEAQASSSSPSTSKRRADEAMDLEPAPGSSSAAEATGSGGAQRRRVLDTGRGRRMLGLLNQTLSQAKQDEEKRNSGAAAKRRADLEARMASKREADSAELRANLAAKEEVRRAERAIQAEAQAARKLANLIVSGDAEHATRKLQKRRLSAFLVTSGSMALEQGEALERANRERRRRLVESGAEDEEGKILDARALADLLSKEGTTTGLVVGADVAMALHPPRELRGSRGRPPPRSVEDLPPRDAHPVYFLPRQLTANQERRLDDQEDAVDAELDKADEEWRRRREALVAELDRVKERIRGMIREGGGKRGEGEGRGEDSEMKGAEEGDARGEKQEGERGGKGKEDKDEAMAE